MADYAKPWLSLNDQVEKLRERGVVIEDELRAIELLSSVGYYRMAGYLYPFRESPNLNESPGKGRSRYREGTSLTHGEELINFDLRLRLLVMGGIERIEVAMRMRIGYVLGRGSVFAHEDPHCFTSAFTKESTDFRHPESTKHHRWLLRVKERKDKSDVRFVAHFREKYEDRIPVWALMELLELGQLAVLYRGMRQFEALEIAGAFGIPTKKLLSSWLASLNYVRNVAAHHARLYNRKLQYAPARPKVGLVPGLDHLRHEESARAIFGVYAVLAVMSFLLRRVTGGDDWRAECVSLLRQVPNSPVLRFADMGIPEDCEANTVWQPVETQR